MNRLLSLLSIAIVVVAGPSTAYPQQNWPQFRGPAAAGVSDSNPPIEWDAESGKNVLWKSRIPGLAHSSPIVWSDHVFLTTAVNAETDDPTLQTGWLNGTGKAAEDKGDWSWQVICLDRKSGKQKWAKKVAEGQPRIQRHLKATHANCTPATDGKHVVAFFGSEGLYCLDFDGKILWQKDFGKLHSGPYNAKKLEWGFASSPIIYQDKVIVQCDCLNTAFVSILNITDGKEIRRIEREDVATWSSPAVVETESGPQLICNGYKQMAGYSLNDGKILWHLKGGGDVPVPTPLFAHGLIYLTNGHGRSPTYVVSPSARGDLTPPKEKDEKLPSGLAWWQPRDGSYMPTPIIVGDYLYTCNDNGVLTVRDAKSGEKIYKQRVGSTSTTYSASAVATPKQIYFSGEKGIVNVIKTGKEYELLAENEMAEPLMATPAIVGDTLFLRTTRFLYCIGKKEK